MSGLVRQETVLRFSSGLYLTGVAAFLVVASSVAIRDHLTIPIFDDWRILDSYFSTPLLDWLVAPQNGHHVPLTLLLFALDYEWFGGRMHLLTVASVFCAWVTSVVLFLGLWISRGVGDPLSRALFGFVCFAFFWAAGSYDLLWGMNQGSVLARLLLFLALACTMALRRRLTEADGAGLWPLAAAVSVGLLATFSHGMGVAVWISLVAVSLAGRLPWRVTFVFVAAGAVSLAIYLLGIEGGPEIASAGDALLRPVDLLEFTVAFIGAPVAVTLTGLRALPPESVYFASRWFGGVGLAAGAGLLLARRCRVGPWLEFSLGPMTFAAAGAAMVGLVRLTDFVPEQAVTLRFLGWSSLYWIGVIVAVATLVRGARARAAFVLSLFALSLCMLPGWQDAHATHRGRQRFVLRASVAVAMGIQHEPTGTSLSLISLDLVNRVAARLKKDRRSFFADPWAQLHGTSFGERFVTLPTRCRGVTRTSAIATRTGLAGYLSGWVSASDALEPPEFVIATDKDGILRGLGRFLPPLREGAERSSGAAMKQEWVGFVSPFDPIERYRIYLVLPDHRSACTVGP